MMIIMMRIMTVMRYGENGEDFDNDSNHRVYCKLLADVYLIKTLLTFRFSVRCLQPGDDPGCEKGDEDGEEDGGYGGGRVPEY